MKFFFLICDWIYDSLCFYAILNQIGTFFSRKSNKILLFSKFKILCFIFLICGIIRDSLWFWLIHNLIGFFPRECEMKSLNFLKINFSNCRHLDINMKFVWQKCKHIKRCYFPVLMKPVLWTLLKFQISLLQHLYILI